MFRSKEMVEEVEVEATAPSGTMGKNKQMRKFRAPVGIRDYLHVDMGEMSEGAGVAGIPAPCMRTYVDAAYQVVLQAMGKVCGIYDVRCKDVVDSYEDIGGASSLWRVELFCTDPL